MRATTKTATSASGIGGWLSSTSQPAINPCTAVEGDVVVVFNGEIYNYVELREELIGLGHDFVTTSDTEVIIAAYKQWGADCQQKFNGMWAIALWDVRKQQLLLSARSHWREAASLLRQGRNAYLRL